MKEEEVGETLDVMYENNKAKIKQTNKRKAESIPYTEGKRLILPTTKL